MSVFIVPDGTLERRTKDTEIAKELLRREHNVKGQQFRDGDITQAEWDSYKADVFKPKNDSIIDAQADLRAELKNVVRALPDDDPEMKRISLEDDFT